MNKKNYLWWAVGLVVLILAVYLLATLTTPAAENTAVPTKATKANDATANPLLSVPAAGSTVATGTPTPVPNNPSPAINKTPKPIATPDFMTAKEKEGLKIDPKTKVQILQRLPDGTIGAYKVINSDSDVLTSF